MSLTTFEFDPAVDLLRALLWQHNDAVNLQSLLTQKQAWYDANQAAFWNDWVRDVFDLRTANEFGLSVWAKILDVPLAFTTGASTDGKVGWGFGAFRRNFNNGNFKRTTAGSVTLSIAQKRLVLRLRYFQLVTNGSILDINPFIAGLFAADYGVVYARDNLDMTATYVFETTPPSELQLVLDEFDVLPRPVGVAIDYETP